MRRVNLRRAPLGAVLAQPLVDERGAYVLAAGQPLNPPLVQRLWERNFRYAYVEELGFEGLDLREPLEPKTYALARRLTVSMVDEIQNTRSLADVELPLEELNALAADACDELAQIPTGEGFLLYPGWGTRRDERLAFVINAAVLAAVIGLGTGRGVAAARHLFTAALLQDIGIWRAEKAPDHVAIVREMLRPMRGVSALVKAIVAQHHERLDGSGYPEGKTGADMHPLARIMSVVVAYLELLETGQALLPHDAQEAMMAGVGTEFDREAVVALLKHVPAYPVGTMVRLSNGKEAVVIHPGPPGLNRPRVRLLPSEDLRTRELDAEDTEQAREELVELELSGEFTLVIKEVL